MDLGLSVLEIRAMKLASGTPLSVTGIAASLEVSKPVASRTVKRLEQKGFLDAKRNGKRKEAALSKAPHALAFKELLTANPHADMETVLSYSTIRVLSGMVAAPFSVREISKITATPEITVRRTLAKLLERGFVARARPAEYRIILPRLKEFVQAFATHALESKRADTSGSLICVGPQALLRSCEKSVPKFMALTGTSIFHKYGVPIIQTDYKDYYFNAFEDKARKPTMEEAIIHSLVRSALIASGREASYAMLAAYKNLEKLEEHAFLEAAREFAVLGAAEQCLKLVKEFKNGEKWPEPTVKDVPRLEGVLRPSWEEFEELVKQYE